MTTLKSTGIASIRLRPRRLGHVNLTVSEIGRSVDFYNRICGLEVTGIERAHGIVAGFLGNGNTHHDIGMVEIPGTHPGLNHFGWEMENERELVDAYRRISDVELPVARLTDQGTSRSIYLNDPDGILHQFYADAILDWRSVYTGGEVVLHGRPSWTPGDPPPTTEPKYHANPEIRRVTQALAHPLRIGRVILFTRNLDQALRFYTEVGGLDCVHLASQNGLACFRGKASPRDLTLVASASETGLARICLEMRDEGEVAAAEARFTEAGLPVEVSIDDRRKRSIVIRDPDGVWVEFYKDRLPDLQALDGEQELWIA
jgi:catechol 2,3-dioxygenase